MGVYVMYKTEKEILSQYSALEKTFAHMMEKYREIKDFQKKTAFDSVTFTGCGSSYSLCKSAESSLIKRSRLKAASIPAGDLMLNFPQYENQIKDTLLIVPSRSGSTSEVILAVNKAKEAFSVPCISICATNQSELVKIADLNIELPWAFDESVCQTRTVTNLYAANLILIGIMTDDRLLLDEIKSAIENGSRFIEENKALLTDIGNDGSWDNVVTLGDSELTGIVEEGALAFKEICQLQSNYYHVLDVRHGPSVLIKNRTLVIIAATPYGENYQKDLIKDLKKQKAVIITVSDRTDNIYGSDYNFTVPSYSNYAVAGIPFIFVPQMLSYSKAVATGINPDLPQGLDPWIKLTV
jgi:glutamine---fructose-6-phosphate transaminase (isomerizing)